MFSKIKVVGEGEKTLLRDEYSKVVSMDGKFEMIVPNNRVEFYCNIVD